MSSGFQADASEDGKRHGISEAGQRNLEGFKEHEFDCIHVHQPMFVGTQAYLGQKYQIPVIYTYHTRYEDYLHYIPFSEKSGQGCGEKR